MAVGFVGKGLGFMAAVVPLGVVTPQAITGGGAAATTYRLLSEGGDNLATETSDLLRRENDG
jgi:Na+-transporting NADH:ubiquinone oxidoreductase subunit NqrF